MNLGGFEGFWEILDGSGNGNTNTNTNVNVNAWYSPERRYQSGFQDAPEA